MTDADNAERLAYLDRAALAALPTMMTDGYAYEDPDIDQSRDAMLARRSYEIAEAMLAERDVVRRVAMEDLEESHRD